VIERLRIVEQLFARRIPLFIPTIECSSAATLREAERDERRLFAEIQSMEAPRGK